MGNILFIFDNQLLRHFKLLIIRKRGFKSVLQSCINHAFFVLLANSQADTGVMHYKSNFLLL